MIFESCGAMRRSSVLYGLKKTTAVLFFTFLFSCGSGKPDVSGISVNIDIERLDREIFENPVGKLPQKYGDFFKRYTANILGIGQFGDSLFMTELERFRNDETVNIARRETEKEYPNLDGLTEKFNHAFKYYRYYFPEKQIPRIVTYISGFNHSLILTDSILAIGLDKYLGADSKLYAELNYAKYMSRNMNRNKIVSDCIAAWISGEWSFSETAPTDSRAVSNNLISKMLYEGKILYATKMILPDEADTLIFGFTKEQLKWCANNEENIWIYLVENKLLFSTDHFTIRKLTEPAPFTAAFTSESPGMACNWTGYRIISKYMKNRPETSLLDLMNSSNYDNIYKQAKYKP
ncbi:MAG: hypothetical protein LBG92_00595 [Prevotellaceae bacterium]|nr:hypothetical protein [Prevotellaceae bacterium]